MNEPIFHICFWILATLVGGVLGMLVGPGFHPWCWYGLLVGVAVSIGIPCLVCLLD